MGDNTPVRKRLAALRDAIKPYGALDKAAVGREGIRIFLDRHCQCDPHSLDAAAKFFGLNPAYAPDRLFLAYLLADAVFGTRRAGRKSGNKITWDGRRLFLLGCMDRDVRAAHPELRGDAKIADKICEGADYKHYSRSPDKIRQRLPAARKELQRIQRLFPG